MGITREHLFHAPDEIKQWILELTGDIFARLSPSVLKLGVVAPLPKDATRFCPVTLLPLGTYNQACYGHGGS